MATDEKKDPSSNTSAHTACFENGSIDLGANGDNGAAVVLNASGHAQQLDRNFSLLSIAAVGIVTGSEWPALGGTVLVAIYNGGAPGVIYEFLAVTFFYCFIFVALAELASSIPSSAGVYHWASLGAGPRFGKVCGFFAGWWNFCAWLLGAASMSSITGNIIISMWAMFHDDYVFQRWHVFIVYLIATWLCCCLVAFYNRAMPMVSNFGLFFILAGFLVTLLVCAIMPSTTGSGYASSSFVWTEWSNLTGYGSDGFVFLAGMLNGAYAVGAVDVVPHLSEELPNPRVNVPKAMFAQLIIGTVTAFAYAVVLFYSISDLDAVLEMTASVPFPVAAIYQQATSSKAGACGLLVVILLPILCTLIGVYITASRILWTLARDNAAPFAPLISRVSSSKSPIISTLICGVLTTILGCIYVGSLTAFNAFVGSFVLLSSLSYIAAILPNLLTRRRYITPGPFALKGILSVLVPSIACIYIVVFVVIFCFPYSLPVTASNMNYAVVITGGFTIFIGLWYAWKESRGYEGPLIMRGMEGRPITGAETKHGEILVDTQIR